MKKLLLLFTFAFGLFTFSFAQQYGWTDLSDNMPELSVISDIHVIGEEVWISGGNDKVYYSPNGGATFAIQNLPPQPGNDGITSSIFMKNNQVGYVATYSGEINKTDDGGTNWYVLHEPGITINSIHFPPTLDKGFACGNNGNIWTFDDFSIMNLFVEGLTATLMSIMFPEDSSEGKLCGDSTIRRWLNNTWNNLQIFDSTFDWNSIFFTDNNTGWVAGTQGKIFRTTDATIWNPQMSGTSKSLNDFFFIDSMEGWAAGTEMLLHTVDGGETWTQELAGRTVGMQLTAIYFTSANNGYVVGNGVVLKFGEISGIGDGVEIMPFEILPNPAKDKFTVQSQKFKVEDAHIEIYDLNGRKLLEKQIKSGSEIVEIDVSHLKSGVYFCRLISENKSATQKLIIQK
jgi:photosystem II stability/assembly factor-like uncharacterized protein